MSHTPQPIIPSRFWLSLTLGVMLTLVAGVLYGNYSLRRGSPADLIAAGEHLKSMPKQLGDWQLLEERTMDEPTLQMLSCAGYVNRQYVNRQTGDTVGIALIVGPPGPIAVHTPEVCYSSRDYEIRETGKRASIDGSNSKPHTFWKTTLRSRSASAERLRVYYAWTTGGVWEATKGGRYRYGAQPMLFKLQLAGLISPEEAMDDRDPPHDFLEALLTSDWPLTPKKKG